MKKKSIIIPVICLVLSVAAMLTMTLLSTPVLYFYSDAKNTYNHETDELEVFKETYKVMETVVKLDPNYSNSYMTSLFCFDCKKIGDSKYREICKDYDRKSLEYAEKLVETAKNSNAEILFLSWTSDEKEDQIAGAIANYANALWYSGKKDEAKKTLEDYIHTLTKDNISCVYAFSLSSATFRLISSTGNDADREWLNNIEKYIVELHNSSIEYKRSTGNYYSIEIEKWEIGEGGRIEQINEEAEK